MKAYGPTTCLAAGAERGVCILWNITGDSLRERERRTAAVLPRPYRRCCINHREEGRRGCPGSGRVIVLH